MTKPERFLWATNTNHAAGADPWSGQPCKVEPAAGKKATGWVPTERPPAEESNWLMNQVGAWVRWASAVQLESWQAADFSGVTPAGNWWTPHAMCVTPPYSTYPTLISALDDDGYVIQADLAGRRWTAEGGGAGTLRALWGSVTPSWCAIAGSHVCSRMAVSDNAVDLVAATPAGAPAWVSVAPATASVKFMSVAHDHNNVWVIGGDTGALYYKAGAAVFAATTPAVPYAQPVYALAHTHDSGNAYFLGAAADRYLKSTDGINWSSASAGWGAFQASDMAYDAGSHRWITVGMATTGDLWYSDDEGVTWTQNAAACPMLSATGRKHIACDGKGGWVVTGSTEGTGTDDVCYYSVDNGITWYGITHPDMFAAGVVYVDGYFATCGYSAAYRTPAGEL